MGALGITVTSTVLGTSPVGREAGGSAVCVHLDEVERAVETAWELRHVDVEGELLVRKVEHLILGVARVHEVHTGTDVRGVRAVRHELQREGVATCGDTVRACVAGGQHMHTRVGRQRGRSSSPA